MAHQTYRNFFVYRGQHRSCPLVSLAHHIMVNGQTPLNQNTKYLLYSIWLILVLLKKWKKYDISLGLCTCIWHLLYVNLKAWWQSSFLARIFQVWYPYQQGVILTNFHHNFAVYKRRPFHYLNTSEISDLLQNVAIQYYLLSSQRNTFL